MLILAMVSTVLLVVWMGFFAMGSLPLLILRHDTPLDASFIRGLVNLYGMAVSATAAVGAAGYALAGRPAIAAVMAGLAAVGFFAVRRGLVSHMDALRPRMALDDRSAIRRFRQLHVAAMAVNVVSLASFAVAVARIGIIPRA